MSRIDDQLREYFDAGVERVIVEDIIAQGAVRNGGVEFVRQGRTLRPVWAAAGAFVLTLVAFGSVSVVSGLIQHDLRDAAWGGIGRVSSSAGGAGIWPIVAASAAGVAALVTWLMRRPRRHEEVWNDGKGKGMETIERTEIEKTRIDQLTKRDRRLTVAIAVLVVAVIGLGAWLIFDSGSETAADLTPVQEQMLETIDAYIDAINAGDGAAVVALMSAAGYHDNGRARYYVAEGKLENYIEMVGQQGISVSRSDAAFVGNYVMTTDHIPADSDADRPSIFRMSTDGTQILWHLAP